MTILYIMYQLPQEIINLIYEFDGTKRKNFNNVLEEFKTIIYLMKDLIFRIDQERAPEPILDSDKEYFKIIDERLDEYFIMEYFQYQEYLDDEKRDIIIEELRKNNI